ncbi:MAG: Cell division protein FtsK [uncultured Paraburkholderia sp.]|nr:MAG: Cell division protein FtsK [uncultured Paraburkholderia sp.]CAH2914715.1 MAG: Cell division protein FtsK [uncultured Paraburkholderia sp.]
MHTVVFGWVGGSAVWFIPLVWRLIKSMLPGGAGLRGPAASGCGSASSARCWQAARSRRR